MNNRHLITSDLCLHTGCLYNKQKYQIKDEVPTPQPCLRCVCGRRGVLMCALRICPPITGNFSDSALQSRCQVVREANTCCPKVQCLPPTAANDLNTNGNPLMEHVRSLCHTTHLFSTSSSSDDQADHQQTGEHLMSSNEIKSTEKSVTTVTPLIALESSLFAVNRLENRGKKV